MGEWTQMNALNKDPAAGSKRKRKKKKNGRDGRVWPGYSGDLWSLARSEVVPESSRIRGKGTTDTRPSATLGSRAVYRQVVRCERPGRLQVLGC